jgi:GNAT superfamily N-acetyltransferase
MNELKILPATPADVPTILALIRELADYEKLSHEVVATEELLARALFGPRPVAECLLARADGEGAAFALFFHNFSTFLGRPGLYLEDLFVRPAHRGRGIGAAMLRHLARLAVERGCGRMEWSVLDWNKRAIEFYERMGAYGLDEWKTYRLTGSALERLGS